MKERHKFFKSHIRATNYARLVHGRVYTNLSVEFYDAMVKEDFPEARKHFDFVVIWYEDYTEEELEDIERRCPFV